MPQAYIRGPKGDAGATGATGATGAQGPQGDPGVVHDASLVPLNNQTKPPWAAPVPTNVEDAITRLANAVYGLLGTNIP